MSFTSDNIFPISSTEGPHLLGLIFYWQGYTEESLEEILPVLDVYHDITDIRYEHKLTKSENFADCLPWVISYLGKIKKMENYKQFLTKEMIESSSNIYRAMLETQKEKRYYDEYWADELYEW